MPGKTVVYSWRVAPGLKSQLEDAARQEGRSMAELLDTIVTAHLSAAGRARADEADYQSALHRRVAALAGCVQSGKPDRGAAAGALVRQRLHDRRRHAD
jgi:hypothetical protein